MTKWCQLKATDKYFPAELHGSMFQRYNLRAAGDLNLLTYKKLLLIGAPQPSLKAFAILKNLTLELWQQQIIFIANIESGLAQLLHVFCLQQRVGILVPQINNGTALATHYQKLRYLITMHGAIIRLEINNSKTNLSTLLNYYAVSLANGLVFIENSDFKVCNNFINIALELNKEIFVVPWSLDHIPSTINNNLIKQGAKLIESVNDILLELAP